MRTRERIEEYLRPELGAGMTVHPSESAYLKVAVELLLDIRDLLKDYPHKQN